MQFRLSLALEYAITAAICAVVIVLAAFSAQFSGTIMQALRLATGLVMVLFIPGYYLHLILFPEADALTIVERLGFSFVLSISIIPISALLLDLALVPLNQSSIIAFLVAAISVFGGISALQRLRLAEDRRFVLVFDFNFLSDAREMTQRTRFLVVLAVVALIAGLLLTVSIVLLPSPSDFFTEFYILGDEGFAEGFPRRIDQGEAAAITVNIENQEESTARYTIEIVDSGAVIYTSSPIELEPGAGYEETISVVPVSTGDDVLLLFHLYLENNPEIYRELRLYLAVTPER